MTMLSFINSALYPQNGAPAPSSKDNRLQRNEEEDLKLGVGYLYEFRKKLNELHPNCVGLIEHMFKFIN